MKITKLNYGIAVAKDIREILHTLIDMYES